MRTTTITLRTKLRLATLVVEAAQRVAEAEGKSLDEWVARAIAEKLDRSKLGSKVFWELARAQAKPGSRRRALEILARAGGEPPRPGDEIPEDLQRPRAARPASPRARSTRRR